MLLTGQLAALHTHTYTKDLHRGTICRAAVDNRGPPCHEGEARQLSGF